MERWSVRALRRKTDSMLSERTAISKKPEEVVRNEVDTLCNKELLTPDLIFNAPYLLLGWDPGGRQVPSGTAERFFADFGSSRIRGKRRVEGNQTILVWHASASNGRHIRDMRPELEALVTLTAPHKSGMNPDFSVVPDGTFGKLVRKPGNKLPGYCLSSLTGLWVRNRGCSLDDPASDADSPLVSKMRGPWRRPAILILTEIPCRRGCNDQGSQTILVWHIHGKGAFSDAPNQTRMVCLP